MNLFDELRQQANSGGPSAVLAQEIINIREQYTRGELNRDEYEFLLSEIVTVKAQQELASDEIACRWICAAAEALISVA